MPCRTDGYDTLADERKANRRRYRLDASDLSVARQVACTALRILEARDLLRLVPAAERKWWAEHKRADAYKKEQRRAAVSRMRARRIALAKLTRADKALLGLEKE